MTGPFNPTAHLYDVTYAHLDYEGHAAQVEEIVKTRNPGATSLLDVACGTGKHLALWRGRFDHLEGTDVDPRMLEVARERLDDVPLHVADFTDFDFGRTFDAVTCLFSSIGYAHTEERLDAAIAAMARHLSPGGVLVVEPWLTPDRLQGSPLRTHTIEREDIALARTSRLLYDGGPEGGISDMEMAYLFTTMDGTEFHTEHHLMGVRPPGRLVEAAEKAGLQAEFDHEGTFLKRGLLIATRS